MDLCISKTPVHRHTEKGSIKVCGLGNIHFFSPEPYLESDSLQTLEKTENQLVLHVTSHTTEAEGDILPDYKKCKNPGTKENMPRQSSHSLQTPRVVFAKVGAFSPIHLYVWYIEKTVDKEQQPLEETEQSILCFHLAKFSELEEKNPRYFPHFIKFHYFTFIFETFTTFLTFSDIYLCINSSTRFAFQIVHLI